MLALFLLSACTGKYTTDNSGDDTGYAYKDTSPLDDSDSAHDTVESVDSEPIIDSDTDTVDSDTDTGAIDDTGPVEPSWLSLQVWPASIVVHPAATWTLRVVGTDPDGASGDLPDDRGTPTFTTDDAAVATVDASGVVTAVATGTTTVRVSIGGLEAQSLVEVRDDGLLTITVLDGYTGLPIEDARVALPFTAPIRTDASGMAQLEAKSPGEMTFSAWVDDTYDALTVTGLVGRQVTVSVLPKDTTLRDAAIEGNIDYTNVDDAGWSDVVVGFAVSSIQGSLGATELEDLFADERTITVFGVDAEVPANLFVETYADDFSTPAMPGQAALWGLAGPVAISDVTSGLSGSGDALGLLADNLASMSWGQVTGLTMTAATVTNSDLAPADRFDGTLDVSAPPLSTGFVGDEEYFFLTTEERADEGFLVTGLGTGTAASTTTVSTVLPGTVVDSLGTSVLAYAQVDGVGSGGPVSAAVGTDDGSGTVIVPMLQDIALIDGWDASSHTLTVTTDADAHFVRIRLRDERNRIHDILAPASWSGDIPNCVTDFRWANAEIEVLSLETATGSYEDWLATGDIVVEDKDVVTAARTTE